MARRHKKVIWTKQGYSTLDEAVGYIAQDSLTAAQHLLESALDTAESLSLFSERGRVVPALQKQCSYDLRQRATEAHGSACVRHYGHRQKENMPAKSSAISQASYVSRSKFSSHSMIRESPLA